MPLPKTVIPVPMDRLNALEVVASFAENVNVALKVVFGEGLGCFKCADVNLRGIEPKHTSYCSLNAALENLRETR